MKIGQEIPTSRLGDRGNSPDKSIILPGSCSYAERGLLHTFNAMQAAANEETVGTNRVNYNSIGWTVIAAQRDDETWRPVAVQKPVGEPTALLLEDLDVDGRHIQAGSLLALDLAEKPSGKRQSAPPRIVTPLSNLEYIIPLRPSEFTYTPERRTRSFLNSNNDMPLARARLDELASIAERAIASSTYVEFAAHSLMQRVLARRQ